MIAVTFIVVVLNVAINLALPVIVRKAIDDMRSGNLGGDVLSSYLLWYGLGGALAVFFSLWTRWLPNRIAHRVEYALRRDVFSHLSRMDRSYYRSQRTGDLITRMTSDMTTLRNAIGQGMLQGMRSTMVFFGAYAVMFMTDVRLALIMTALAPIVGVMFYVLIKRIRVAHERVQEQYANVTNFSHESFSGIRNIKGSALEERWVGFFKKLNTDLLRRYMRLSVEQQPLWPLAGFFFSLGMIAILIVGGLRVINEQISLGALVQFMQYLLYMQWPILALSWIASLVQRGMVSWDRINMIFERQPAITDGEHINPELKTVAGDISFKNVGLQVDSLKLLENINLRIPSGSTVGITGPTGGGKSLLVSLLARLADPTEGEIRIGGHEIHEYPLRVLRSHIGFATQEPILFSRPLGENIAFGVNEARVDIVSWAARIAHLDVDVDAFPDSYDTVLGERGVTLSGGQRQRTSLSRAIAREPAILILDDVLSAVDTQTEAGIMQKLLPIMRDRTSILVSHRISTLSYTDFIIVVEDGRITQRGAHEELQGQPGYYAELSEIQQIESEMESRP